MTIQSLFRGHYFLIFKNFFYNNETFCLIVNIMEVKMFYRPLKRMKERFNVITPAIIKAANNMTDRCPTASNTLALN